MKNITHLVFSGCGLISISLLGILRYLYCYNLTNSIKNVAGTSMGSFFCLAFALKIPYEELEKIIINMASTDDIIKVKNDKILNLLSNNGLEDARIYLKYIKEYIKKTYDMDDMTFIELSKKTGINLYVSSTEINTCKNKIFNINDTPNISILDAVASSMTVPYISEPILIDGYYYIDGGFTNNFPIDLFDNIPNDNILGVVYNILSYNNISPNIEKDNKMSIIDYSLQLLKILFINTNQLVLLNKIDKSFLILDESPINTFLNLEFTKDTILKKISHDDIDKLIIFGYIKTGEYLHQ